MDEFHELFFNQPLAVINNHLVSVIQRLMMAHRIIAVSATFREEAGIKKINKIHPDSVFILMPDVVKEKILQFNIIGGRSSE